MTINEVPSSQIKVKIAYNGNMLVTYIDQGMDIDTLNKEIIDICNFNNANPFTIKWIDDEGDPCMLTNQKELDEALRLYEINEENDITIHVFAGVPEAPGFLCPGEDKNVYRRGAKRWRKLYRINGHLFQLKRFSRKAVCVLCNERIWGLGRQGFKCVNCKLLIHKKCHLNLHIHCTNANHYQPYQVLSHNTSGILLAHESPSPIFASNIKDTQPIYNKKTSVFSKYSPKSDIIIEETSSQHPSSVKLQGALDKNLGLPPQNKNISQSPSNVNKTKEANDKIYFDTYSDIESKRRDISSILPSSTNTPYDFFPNKTKKSIQKTSFLSPPEKYSDTNVLTSESRFNNQGSGHGTQKQTHDTNKGFKYAKKLDVPKPIATPIHKALGTNGSSILGDITEQFPILTTGIKGGKKVKKTSLANSPYLAPSNSGKKSDLTLTEGRYKSFDDTFLKSDGNNNSNSSGFGIKKISRTPKKEKYALHDFELIKVIGRGSYAKVFLVELKETRKVYAMKVIKKELINDEEDVDWVQTEKHVFETATHHPFLVGLHSCFQTPSRLIFVIEFVNGGDLMFHMQRQRRLPEDHARFYAAEIITALNFLHKRGIIYRDLKLDNVLLDSDGHIRLTDYGMCKEGLSPTDKTGTFCGTPNYIAPEILKGDDYGFSVDWWALGVLMFEMLAGRSPFDIVGAADNPDHNTEDYLFQVILEKTIRIPRSISVKAASILKGFLNKDPAERIGCHPETGYHDIISHCFFKTIDWDLLEKKQLTPPYKPKLSSDRAVDNFDPQFTNEQPILTPDDTNMLDRIDQSEFDGFEFVNPLLD